MLETATNLMAATNLVAAATPVPTPSPACVCPSDLFDNLSIFMLAIFVGYYVVWRVTPALHAPLMSVTNAISSVIIVGALIATGVKSFELSSPAVTQVLGFIAVALASVNSFGGFIITGRMLGKFRKKPRLAPAAAKRA